MPDYSKNFLTSMTGLINFNDDPVKPRNEPLPLYKPKDTTLVSFDDQRKINPATGLQFKKRGTKSIKANEEDVKAIISQAKYLGVDPYTALAVGLQETELGRLDPNYGSAWATFADEGIVDEKQQNANILAKALKDKLNYASELRKRGVIPQGEEYDLQVYNGLGLLRPRGEIGGVVQDESYYEIPVTAKTPLDLKKNPAYGKIVKQLRDEVVKTNPRIVELVNKTAAYQKSK